jgi:MFS family permease
MSMHEGDHGERVRRAGERLAHESTLVDPRPRETRRTKAFGSLLAGGFVVGAVAGAIATWIVALIAGDHFSVLTYLIVAAVMGGVAMAIVPFISLARADGHDADIVRTRRMTGGADAPLDGAQSVDNDASPMRTRHARS